MIVLYPITYPLAKVLDKVFGEHNVMRFQKNELKALIELHEIKVDDSRIKKDKKVLLNIQINIKSGFTQEEIQMLTSTIDLKEKSVVAAMIPLKQIVMFNSKVTITQQTIEKISTCGYSNVVVYDGDKSHILWTLKTKQFIGYGAIGKNFGALQFKKNVLVVASDTNLLEMLMIFKIKHTKLAFINEKP